MTSFESTRHHDLAANPSHWLRPRGVVLVLSVLCAAAGEFSRSTLVSMHHAEIMRQMAWGVATCVLFLTAIGLFLIGGIQPAADRLPRHWLRPVVAFYLLVTATMLSLAVLLSFDIHASLSLGPYRIDAGNLMMYTLLNFLAGAGLFSAIGWILVLTEWRRRHRSRRSESFGADRHITRPLESQKGSAG